MKLIQVGHSLVTSGNEVQTVQLEQVINTEDTHILFGNNICVGADGGILDVRPMVDSSPDTTSNIDIAWTKCNSDATPQQFGNPNQNFFRITDGMTTSPNKVNFVCSLYGWYSSSEYSHFTIEATGTLSNNTAIGHQQGGLKHETTSFNGIQLETNQSGGGGFQAGSQFVLYKVVS
tara:strand:- start:469 stop:996 length:528 start_codon:yes stop_codon:yes gene_type:complete